TSTASAGARPSSAGTRTPSRPERGAAPGAATLPAPRDGSRGGVPEWLNGAVSKTVVRHWRTEGSNPSPSVSVCGQRARSGFQRRRQHRAVSGAGQGVALAAGVGEAGEDAAAVPRAHDPGDEAVLLQARDDAREGALAQVHGFG